MHIDIYTDGSALGNPGKGGYGIVLKAGNYYKELSQGYRYTTNNRMELLAVIIALESIKLKDSDITLYSDSKYVIDAINLKWLDKWLLTKFKNIKNSDLWLRFHRINKTINVKYIWVKGHNNNKYNEICDKLAVGASNSNNLLIDEVYEIIKNDVNI